MNEQQISASCAGKPRRALERHGGLRLSCALLWCSFLGATLSMVTLQLMPRDWTLPPATLEAAGPTFMILWVLAFVPTMLAVMLLAPRKEGN